jgi:hypothetical protein
MLEVGNFASSPAALAYTESRTHFGAWCIVSSPLVLGLDVTDGGKLDAVWEIISNTEAIAVNQQWAGQPGRLVASEAAYQVWAKQLPGGDVAVLVLNRGSGPVDVAINASSIAPSLTASSPARDIWKQKNVSGVVSADGAFRVSALPSHDSAFYRFAAPARARRGGRPSAATAALWPAAVVAPASPPVAAQGSDGAAAARKACERVQGGGAGECALLTTCEQRCAAAGHCCVGATSGYSLPSCAQGCTVGKQAKTVATCNAACAAADGKCKWAFNSTLFQNCGSCPSTCCNAPVKGECQQGCAFAFD